MRSEESECKPLCGCSPTENTVSKIIDNCCKQESSSPDILTKYFIKELLQEMAALIASENLQCRIDVINQISKVISRIVFGEKEDQHAERTDQKLSSSSKFDLKPMVQKLKKIDDSILELFAKKKLCYQQIANTENIQVSSQMDGGPCTLTKMPFNIKLNKNNGQPSYPVSPLDLPASESINKERNFFGNLTLRAASFYAARPYELKAEVDLNTVNIKNIELKSICDTGALHMEMLDNNLICVSDSNQFFSMNFNPNYSLIFPEFIVPMNKFKGKIMLLSSYQNNLFITSLFGFIYKCRHDGPVIKSLSIPENVSCGTDFEGVLYIVSTTDKFYAVNMRSMTLLKEPFQLDEYVKQIKVIFHENRLVMMYTTKKGIIGRFICDGVPSPVVMKTECPSLDCTFLEISSSSIANMITIFCCSSTLSFGICVFEPFGANASTVNFYINGPSSAMYKFEEILLLGSFSGHIILIDITKRSCYRYCNVLKHPITAISRKGNHVYLSSLSSIVCMVFNDHEFK